MADANVNIWIRLRDKATKTLRKIRRRFPLLARAIARLRVDANRTWAAMKRGLVTLGRWVKRTMIAFVAFATYLGQKFVRDVVTAGAEAERFAMQLRHISDSAKEAEKDMQWVRRFAAKTPFYTQEVVTAFNMLKAVGIKDVKEVVTASGDAAFMMGRDITDVSMAFISLQRRVWRRLGVDLDRTGKKVAITTGRMRVETSHDVEEIRKGLLKVLVGSFGGAMKKAERTWTGMLALFWSEWWEFKVKVAESGVFDFFKSGLHLVLKWIQKMKREGKLEEWAAQISQGMLTAAGMAAYMAFEMQKAGRATWRASLHFAKLGLRLERFNTRSGQIFGSFTDTQERLAEDLERIDRDLAIINEELESAPSMSGMKFEASGVKRIYEDVLDNIKNVKQTQGGAADETERAARAARGLREEYHKLTDLMKGQLSAIDQVARASDEQKRDLRMAVEGADSMTRATWERNEKLRQTVYSNEHLKRLYQKFIDMDKLHAAELLGISEQEMHELDLATDIVTKVEQQIGKERRRLELEQSISKELRDQVNALEKMVGMPEGTLRLTPGGWTGPQVPFISPPTPATPTATQTAVAAQQQAATAAAQRAAQAEEKILRAVQQLVDKLDPVKIENEINLSAEAKVDVESLAAKIAEMFGGDLSEATVRVKAALSDALEDQRTKLRQARAAVAQAEAN